MFKKILALTLLLSFQVKAVEPEKTTEVTTQEAEELSLLEANVSEQPANELVRSHCFKRFASILVRGCARINSLNVCHDVIINGNLRTVGNSITDGNVELTGGNLSVDIGSITAGSNITAGDNITAGGNVTAGGNFTAAGSGTFDSVTIGNCTLDCSGSGLVINGQIAGTTPFSMFYGLTTGVGSGGTDYAATIAPGARMPFPQNGPTTAGGITRIDNSSFTLPAIGTYEVAFQVHTTEPGQMQLELNGLALANTTAVNMNPTAGGHPIIGHFFITTTSVSSVLAVINPAGNATALTITPANGSLTHANSQVLTIKQLA